MARIGVLDRARIWVVDEGYSTGGAQTIEDLLDELLRQIEKKTALLCAQTCERAGVEGYGTIAASVLIRDQYSLPLND